MAASAVWQKVGIEKIPRCWQNFEQAGNVMRLWIDLWFPFTEAHTTPVDEELIGQIYDYASWCWTESRSYHSQTAVACAFYEHLPLEPKVREQIAKWISVDLFEGLKEVFRYHLGEQLGEFVREFYEQREKLRCENNRDQPSGQRENLAVLGEISAKLDRG
jgi:hypothetical protein